MRNYYLKSLFPTNQAYLPSSDLDVVVIGPHYTSKVSIYYMGHSKN